MSASISSQPLDEVGRFPLPGDNAVIATRDLEKGMRLIHEGREIVMVHDVLTGHRFAARGIEKGEAITSWEYPFGLAVRDIQAGEYLCNQGVLERFAIQQDERYLNLSTPDEANFVDDMPPYDFDEEAWRLPAELKRYAEARSFSGFDRGNRGTGTRNLVVVLGVTSRTSALAQRVAEQFQGNIQEYPQVDDVVAIRHTEGAETDAEERDRTLRTLAGLAAHPNVGALVCIDSPVDGEISNAELIGWMADNGVSTNQLPVHRITSSDSFEDDLERIGAEVAVALAEGNGCERSERPISELKIGLQCGASDAFSGISGNVLSAAIAREVIYHGGSANLSETPELAGAEDYTLSLIGSPEIGPRFIEMLDRFKRQLGWHGGKVDKNPSEGNLLGGLYNITLKSLGAAVKRDPDVPLAHLIEYGERMDLPGFFFMDGMGGDIASYTGQAAAGCNIVLFVTGRGTPTNSSIVPTIKIVNTTERYGLMEDDIDINAGRYLDGMPMPELTDESLDRVVSIASGEKTKGEKARQNIDLFWRRKFFMARPEVPAPAYASRLSGRPRGIRAGVPVPVLDLSYEGLWKDGRVGPREQVGLILPTVGCSVATAEQAARRLSQGDLPGAGWVSRFVVLPNTEGCGVTTGAEIMNFMLGYSSHALVARCLFLSLGCEMVSLNFLRSAMSGNDVGFPEITEAVKAKGLELDNYGWLTIQGARGTQNTIVAAEDWFRSELSSLPAPETGQGGAGDLRLGLMSDGGISEAMQRSLSELVRAIVGAGGSVVISEGDGLCDSETFNALVGVEDWSATLSFAQTIDAPGLLIMQSITDNPVERVTGLGSAVDLIVNVSSDRAAIAHALIPTLNVSDVSHSADFDCQLIAGEEERWSQRIADLIRQVMSGKQLPLQNKLGQVGNQIARGARAHAI